MRGLVLIAVSMLVLLIGGIVLVFAAATGKVGPKACSEHPQLDLSAEGEPVSVVWENGLLRLIYRKPGRLTGLSIDPCKATIQRIELRTAP